MKFVRYQVENKIVFGIIENNTVSEIRGSIFSEYEVTASIYRIDEIRLLSPVEPSKIICVCQEHLDRLSNINQKPEVPNHSMKPPSASIGPGDSIIYPKIGGQISSKGQLSVVIKDKIRNVSEDEAMNHVLGFTCFNDIIDLSLTDVGGQWFRAQAFDTFAPFGPCVATGLNPLDLEVKAFLNGELVQTGKCCNTVFPVPYLVHYISQSMTLFPGDIISTGTPIGVVRLQPGDVVEINIEGIGTLRNPVRSISD
jgi:2-keto-4-pentenoate hydratase/2-oxohepta-3-ene-1,7-dioic acid hydratase in catechol pathway